MVYLLAEDSKAGLEFWNFVNKILFNSKLQVIDCASNQNIIDVLLTDSLHLKAKDVCFVAVDNILDNSTVLALLRTLTQIAANSIAKIVNLEVVCFEYFILRFEDLIAWTGTNNEKAISFRQEILQVFEHGEIRFDLLPSNSVLLQMIKNFSGNSVYGMSERVLKSVTAQLTDNDEWYLHKGRRFREKEYNFGSCWHQDCCIFDQKCNYYSHRKCGFTSKYFTGEDKLLKLLFSDEVQRVLKPIYEYFNELNDNKSNRLNCF